MIAYKATYNYKCRNQTYKVGKTYTSDKLKICFYGMHYCDNMEDTLNYYDTTKDFTLLEVEILGDVETKGNKSVTNKLKVLRIVPPDEYTDSMKSQFPVYEYDSLGNSIIRTDPSGRKTYFEYDDRGNQIRVIYPDREYTFEYDDHGNMISLETPDFPKTTFEYDDRGNKIRAIFPDGERYIYEYDDHNNMISEISPYNNKQTFDVAIITEED